MSDLALLETSELVTTIKRAQALLDDGDAHSALMLASGAYDQAKAAGGYAERVKASRSLVDKARRLQADALKIEALSYCAMADAVDDAQEKGQIARPGRKSNISGENIFTLDDVGLSAKRVHEARKLRNAERADPGFIERVLDERLAEELEPSRAGLQKAVKGIGTRSRSDDERNGDSYFTSAEAMPVLLALESFSAVIKEPACGAGHISTPMETAGYEVILSDIKDRGTTTRHGEVQQVGDFLLSRAGDSEGVDIVTNPPYGRKVMNRFIAHALREHKPQKMALLLNLNVLCGFDDEDRKFIMDENPPSRAYVFTRRLPMMHQEGWLGEEASSQMNTAWFIWERNSDGVYGTPGAGTAMHRVDWKAFEGAELLAPGEGGHVSPMRFAVEEDFTRETPRKSLDERVDEERARALVWIAEQDGFTDATMRRGLGLRRSTVDALIIEFSERSFIANFEDVWRITEDGRSALNACAGALVGLAAIEAVDGPKAVAA